MRTVCVTTLGWRETDSCRGGSTKQGAGLSSAPVGLACLRHRASNSAGPARARNLSELKRKGPEFKATFAAVFSIRRQEREFRLRLPKQSPAGKRFFCCKGQYSKGPGMSFTLPAWLTSTHGGSKATGPAPLHPGQKRECPALCSGAFSAFKEVVELRWSDYILRRRKNESPGRVGGRAARAFLNPGRLV